ncbi:MAG: peptidoglycan-binding protein [Acidobacteriaceae bacterium]|nr:peptidoglycan-binding protein [Acidobacteriaceae bacterium]MBV9764047.1 peptidoglycan-binding protein [Acidobacteriaceae bacterium]
MKCVLALMLLGVAAFPVPAKPVPAKAKVAKSSKTARRVKGRRVARAVPAPSYQLQPDPDRYQEIQRALADKGYFRGEANGTWGDDSVDALKRFQVDQKLTDDGKISALTLIGLGLGPKHDSSALTTPK